MGVNAVPGCAEVTGRGGKIDGRYVFGNICVVGAVEGDGIAEVFMRYHRNLHKNLHPFIDDFAVGSLHIQPRGRVCRNG